MANWYFWGESAGRCRMDRYSKRILTCKYIYVYLLVSGVGLSINGWADWARRVTFKTMLGGEQKKKQDRRAILKKSAIITVVTSKYVKGGFLKVKLKKISLIGLMVALVLCILIGCADNGKGKVEERLAFATASTASSIYMIGGGIAEVVSREHPEIAIAVETCGQSLEAGRLIGREQVELVFVASTVAYDLYKGEGLYGDEGERYDNIRYICAQADSYQHIVAHPSLKIDTLYDIKNLNKKPKVAIAQLGPAYRSSIQILEKHGLKEGVDFEALPPMSASEGWEGLRDGHHDLVFVWSGFPNPGIQELEVDLDLHYIGIGDDIIEYIRGLYGEGVFKGVMPVGTYKGQDEEVGMQCLSVLLLTHKNMSEDTIYKITKSVMENNDALVRVHPTAVEMGLDNVLRCQSGIEMHPGAEKYYKEIGLVK